jgi:hypothetical protein
MTEPQDPRSVIESAERAAAEGDHRKAAELLREAARLQEASLGPLHPDLANTLNNLGVVYEMLDSPADAEACYRRAYAIALSVLVPDHPFVATSGENLREFCEARGRPFEPAAGPRAEPQKPPPAVVTPRVFPVETPPAPPPPIRKPAMVAARSSRRFVIGTLFVLALALAAFIVTRLWVGPDVGAGFSPDQASSRRASAPAAEPTTAPAPAAPPAPVGEPAPATVPPPVAAARAARPADNAASPPAATGAVHPAVVEATVCRRLSTGASWTCDPVSSPEPGTFFFYTRLKSASDTTVEHRWYHGERLHQAVELRVLANPGSGYRTFSRNTVSRVNAGEWRVELRAKDGTLLDEARLTVR